MDINIASVEVIVILSYFLGVILKMSKLNNKWIPICCGVFGMILGIVGYFIHMPDLAANDPITAAASGLVSGLGATGVHQIYKQLSKDNEPTIPETTDSE